MKTVSSHSLRQRPSSTGPAAPHTKTCPLQYAVPSSGRGGTASTSGRGQFTLTPVRAVRLTDRGVLNAAAALQPGGLGLSELLDQDLAEPALTPRRIMNRRIKSCRSPASLSDLVVDEIANFDHQNVAHALSRLAKMFQGRARGGLDHPPSRAHPGNAYSTAARQQQLSELKPALELLTRRMHQLIRNYDSWDVTLSLWSYAQLGYHDDAALRALCEAGLAVTPLFKPADCANAMVAFAYLDYLNTELLRQIVAVVLDSLDDFQPGEVCQVLWGFAKLGCHPGDTLLNEAVATVHRRVRQYGTQELVLVLWSLVRLGHKPGVRFLYDVESTLLQRLPHMAPADLTLSVWTFAHLRYKAVRLLDEVPAAVGPQLRNCSNAELCSLASGFATAHHYHRVLLDAVAGVVLRRLDSLTHQEVCVVLWTYGTFRHRPAHVDFSKQMAATLYGRMSYFAPQGLAMIVKALAQLQWRSEPLLVALIAAAETKLNGFKPLELSQLLWGLTALDCKDLNIYYAVVRRCIAILKDPQHPYYRTMLHHRVVNSVISSCQQLGYVPWTLIDFAESKGIRVKEPGILSSRDEDDEGMVAPLSRRVAPPTVTAPQRMPVEGSVAVQVVWEEVEEGERASEQEEVGEDGDVGSAMAPDVAAGEGSGARQRGSAQSSPLFQLQAQLQGAVRSPAAAVGVEGLALQQEQEQEAAIGLRQDRRLRMVDVPRPLDLHSPLRVGRPPHHHQQHSHHHSHHHHHDHSHGHGAHVHLGNAAGGEPPKVLTPRPRTQRRSAAGGPPGAAAAAASAAHSPPDPGSQGRAQQHLQRGRQKQQRTAAPTPLPLSSPPPPPLSLQGNGVSNGNGSSNGNGNGNGHCVPDAPWVAVER